MTTVTRTQLGPSLLFVDASDQVTGDAIKRRREAIGLSATDLARAADVHRNTVANVEKGKATGAALALVDATLRRLEEATGMDTPDLVTSTITLPDGTKVVFAGHADGVAEAAARYVREQSQS